MVGEEAGAMLRKSSTYKTNAELAPEATGSLCGADNRVAATDRAVGRLTNGTRSDCTVYITANGTVLTAGHCRDRIVRSGYDVAEFDVPKSNSSGTVRHPGINSQYPINVGSIRFEFTGNIGNDWCVFRCNPNSNTGLTPGGGQRAFFRLARDFNPNTARITGCGVDNGRDNQSLQTHTGSLNSETVDNANDAYFRYSVDTEGGNSGSPIIWNGTRTVLGIHTNGGCSSDGNHGTSFEADDVERAINQNVSSNVVHVDVSHRASSQDGVITRPYKSVATAIANTSSGALVSIAPGAYRQRVVLKNVRLQAPVGKVAIGPNANARTASSATKSGEVAGYEGEGIEIKDSDVAGNGQVFPNPFADDITVSFSAQDHEEVDFAVFDLAGHQVAHFVKHEVQEEGSHEMKFDTSQFPTGIYMYQLKIGDQEARGKIIRK